MFRRNNNRMACRPLALVFCVFAIVMAWDYLAPRIKLAQVRRAIALRIRRDAAKARP